MHANANSNTIRLDQPTFMKRPMFKSLHQVAVPDLGDHAHTRGTASSEGRARDLQIEFVSAPSLDKAEEIVAHGLVAKVVRSLSGLSETDIDLGKPIVSCGIDSLLAVEIRSWLLKVFVADVRTFEILGGASFVMIARTVASRSSLRRDGDGA
ncbi:hypothetical protein BDV06DRAFT_228217 [Aspergillus oleicola]